MTPSSQLFAELINNFSSQEKPRAPLFNISFFLGAGFSKAWDQRFPVGNQLFDFSFEQWEPHTKYLSGYLRTHGHRSLPDISPQLFKELIYQLGMYRKYPEIRPRYIDDGNIALVEAELRALVVEKFKSTAPLYYFNHDSQKIEIPEPMSEAQRTIIGLFHKLMKQGDGSQGLAEGIRTHIITTNYDFIPEAILDASCAPDDSFLLYTYRGLTAQRVNQRENPAVVHDNWLVNNLLKINGGFEIFSNPQGFEIDYSERQPAAIRKNPPQIMLPSNEQDYTQAYFKALFPKSIRLLQESNALVIVGYSLPEEDALIRFLLKQFAEDPVDGARKIIFYVDIAAGSVQQARVSSVFPYTNDYSGLTFVPYAGSFSDWAREVLAALSD